MIYLDYASATPVSKKALLVMEPYFSEQFFNPSASYLPAKHVKDNYEYAKSEIAHAIGAKGNDVVITAGATEANNLAFTVLNNYKNGEVLYLATEHASVRQVASQFPHQEISVDKTGLINLKDLQNKITKNTVLISVSLANNELGTIQPLAEIAEIVRAERQKRLADNNQVPLYLHSDASQALSLIDINVARLGVDLLTINSAKVYGPKGVGALYIAHDVDIQPISYGGGQERGLRSGTENVAGVIGFATAAKDAKEHINGNRKKYEKLNQILRAELLKSKIEPIFLGNKKHQLANFCPVCFPGIDAERLIYELEEKQIYVSTGAACAASKGEKSHTLMAISLSDSEITGSIRISMGEGNTAENIRAASKTIVEIINKNYSQKSEKSNKKTVFVGMSGGVDSTVSAALLKGQGYHVVGVYMKNWSKDLPGMKCPWAEDLADAKRAAVKLGIDFEVFDFEKEYKQKVVDYMLAEFKKGHTPNPDIMCNQEIKFKLFYDIAREKGADFIATGHYAKTNGKNLLRAKDENKDQTYFLYRISKDAISHTLFPIGDMLKPDVKKLAEKYGFHNAYKKESMGVCFVGDVGIKDFLKSYIKEIPGEIRESETNKILGYHDGAIFYTIGQRHGLNIGGGLPYYVVDKDMDKNIVYVSKNLNNQNLWTKELELRDVILRENPSKNIFIRLRHRAPLIPAKLTITDTENTTSISAKLEFEQEIKSPAAGQSAVIYAGKNAEICLGGGIIR